MSDLAIKAASTVVLYQDEMSWPPKILLIKRSSTAKFLPGAHVFPGGQVDQEDYNHNFMADNHDLLAKIARYFHKDFREISGHLCAAIRETLEEAGLLIRAEDLFPLSWWVTPASETRRFDTWFFLAPVKGDAPLMPASNSLEVHKPLWVLPSTALAMHAGGRIFLAPPTRSILERMAVTSSLALFLSFVDQPLKAIHPLFIEEEGHKILILPGHERHPEKDQPAFLVRNSYSFF